MIIFSWWKKSGEIILSKRFSNNNLLYVIGDTYGFAFDRCDHMYV